MSELPANLTPGTWKLDTTHAEIGFSICHAGVSKVRGHFNEFSGVALVGDDLGSSAVDVEIQVGSIDTRNEGRDGHLTAPDFFDAENFPGIVFKSTSLSMDGDEVTVAGDITIKGVTQPIVLTGEYNGAATDMFGTDRFGLSIEGNLKRGDFGLTWNAALETGGVMFSDKVKLEIEAEFTKA
ncbi:MAG: YceI family protein [Galactobacter sp.]